MQQQPKQQHQSQPQPQQQHPAEAPQQQASTAPNLKDLRSKCEQAPRYGVNGRYLILQAAKAVAAQERQQQQQHGEPLSLLLLPCTCHSNLANELQSVPAVCTVLCLQ
jgi:hypothetical protein